jgi:hypothetical protein
VWQQAVCTTLHTSRHSEALRLVFQVYCIAYGMSRAPEQAAQHRSKRSAYGVDTDCHRAMKRARWLQNQIVEPQSAAWTRYAGRTNHQNRWNLHYGQASIMGDCFTHRPEGTVTSMIHGKVKVLQTIQASLQKALCAICDEQR